jgi:hypothetical protein
MGDVIIRDPVKGHGAHVDVNSHLHVEAVTRVEKDQAAKFGWKFNVNTGDITLTTANKHSLLYIKNTGDYDIIIDAMIYNLGNTTNGSGDALIEILRNPTAGAIITNTNDVAIGPGVSANQNFGSTETMTGLFYKGANGESAISASDGVTLTTRSASNTGRIVISLGAMALPKGSSMAVDYTPPGSNSSQIVQIAAAVHVRHPDVASL